ncbi:vacuolar protein-sorting-associated protein 25 isoform X2 [Drosophila erecta]|uniref:vacuolar protein-sorting-associated protein 25 isoform X2 n=1 Tax=Drosophila erecta TaxID=7220 RepID=UPI000F048C29|nr:vacuolar protein-sorting-associated protein 25 isoform X2 [Drosophila erecta]
MALAVQLPTLLYGLRLQPHEETRQQQLEVWADLFLKYLKDKNRFSLSIGDQNSPLFHNESLKRRLSPEFVLTILGELERTGHANPLDKRRQEWQVYWFTLEDYGNMVYDWVQVTGQTNTICTLYEIASNEENSHLGFYGVDEAVLLSALRLLEEKGRCELIEMDGSHGVKFF